MQLTLEDIPAKRTKKKRSEKADGGQLTLDDISNGKE